MELAGHKCGFLQFFTESHCQLVCNISSYSKCFQISNTFLSVLKYNVGLQGLNSQNACQTGKQGIPLSDCSWGSSLIWVCTVCLDLFCSQLVFAILEHLCQSDQGLPCLLKSDKYFVNFSPDNHHFIWEQKKKKFSKF